MSRIDYIYITIIINYTLIYNWDCIGARRATSATCENWTCECTKHGGNTLGVEINVQNQMSTKHGV
jgi:hypothetical protein